MQLTFKVSELSVLLQEAYQAGRDSIKKGSCSETSLDDAYRENRLLDIVGRYIGNFLLEAPDDEESLCEVESHG